MMICPEPAGVMEQEQAYLAALQSAATFDIEGMQLSLYGPDGQILLSFTLREPTSLVGTTWQAVSYNNSKGGAVSIILDTEITAEFDQDGTLSGSAGCNNYTATYETDEDLISIGPAASTRKFCAEPEGIMDQESQYLTALETAATYRIDGDRLELRTEDGALVASYVPKQEAAGLDSETLENLEYQSEFTQSGIAPLVDGEYREPAAPGSATETIVNLTDHVAYGQMEGQEVAAVILVTDPGGSGTFYELAIVVEQEGQPLNVATALLGDRVQIHGLSFSGEELIVKMIAHGPDDPMCCPTQEVIQTYALQGGELIQTSNQVVGSTESDNETLNGVVWKWEQFLESNDNTVVVDDPDRYTLEFLADGTVAIQADCNQASGTYIVEGSNLTIEVGPTTLAMCPPGSLSDRYLQHLGQVVSHVFDGGMLALSLRYDTGIMTFIK
jgi:heat shock protein HslJ